MRAGPGLLLRSALSETTEDHCPAEPGCLSSPAAAEGLLLQQGSTAAGGGGLPAPLGLFCSAWGLPFGGEDIHPNPSKTAVGTETQLR